MRGIVSVLRTGCLVSVHRRSIDGNSQQCQSLMPCLTWYFLSITIVDNRILANITLRP